MHKQRWTYSPFRWGRGGIDRTAGAPDVTRAPDLFAHPGPLDRFDAAGPRKRVCVVGGGIAGLTAAYELGSHGHDVVLLEAASRIGGRIWTKRFGDGTYGELGAMRIPAEHLCVWHYVNRFGLQHRDFVSVNNRGWVHLRGVRHRRADWQSMTDLFGLSDDERVPAPQLVENFKEIVLGQLTEPELWNGYSNWVGPGWGRRIEDLTVGQAVRGTRTALFPGLSPSAWEYVGHATSHLWLERTALLHWLREEAALSAPHRELVGGMETLVDAFRAAIRKLGRRVTTYLRARATGLRIQENSVRVHWNRGDAGPREADFDFVICTAPASATARVEFHGALRPRKREALANLSYLSAGKTLIRCHERHWESEDGIVGGSSRTDLPIQQCWYPNDNAVPDEDGDHSLPEAYADDLDPTRAHIVTTDWKARDPEVSRGPGVFLASYTWGTNAQRFASLTDAEKDEMVLRNIASLHPRNEALCDEIVHWSWDAQASPAGGAFAWFAPGEQNRYQEALCEPLLDGHSVPRVLFAGEHVGVAQGWIQGAVQSALASTIHVLRAT